MVDVFEKKNELENYDCLNAEKKRHPRIRAGRHDKGASRHGDETFLAAAALFLSEQSFGQKMVFMAKEEPVPFSPLFSPLPCIDIFGVLAAGCAIPRSSHIVHHQNSYR